MSAPPAMIRVGAVTSASSSLTSGRIKTPSNVLTSAARSTSAQRCRHIARGAALLGSWRNVSPYISASVPAKTTGSETPATRATAPRAISLGTFARECAAALVLSRVSERSRSGSRAAMRIPTKPPVDSPTRWVGAEAEPADHGEHVRGVLLEAIAVCRAAGAGRRVSVPAARESWSLSGGAPAAGLVQVGWTQVEVRWRSAGAAR